MLFIEGRIGFDDALSKATAKRTNRVGSKRGHLDIAQSGKLDTKCIDGKCGESQKNTDDDESIQQNAENEQLPNRFGMTFRVPLLLPPPASAQRVKVTNSILRACHALRQPNAGGNSSSDGNSNNSKSNSSDSSRDSANESGSNALLELGLVSTATNYINGSIAVPYLHTRFRAGEVIHT